MQVAAIATTPVKGLGLNHPEAVDVTTTGVPGDRRFAIVDAEGRIANLKRLGSLVRVRASIGDGDDTLFLHFPDGTKVGGPVEFGEPTDASLYGGTRTGQLVIGDHAAALSDFAGEPLRLVRLPDGNGVDRVGIGAVSLVTTGSLEALRREAAVADRVDGRRFRMTFTVESASAHVEDSWVGRRVRIGSAVVMPVGHIGRCVVTTQNPDSGEKDFDTLNVLARYRGALDTTEKLPFGVHARVVVPGRVAVGDPVTLEDHGA